MILENIPIVDAGAEGMAVGRSGQQVVFVPFGVPGDIADIQITKKKRRYLEGKIVRLSTPSPHRVTPHCTHFGTCGGCRWQHMDYSTQLFFKQKQVSENLTRIGKIENPAIFPILASPDTTYYRNKLDFTFSVYRWRTEEELSAAGDPLPREALGFHVPQFFDKVVDIKECFHQKEPSNTIRNGVRDFAMAGGIPFYDVRNWQGLLRNLIIRTTENGDLMVIMVFREEDPANQLLLDYLKSSFPQITSLWSVINHKKNDTIYDLPLVLCHGAPYIHESIPAFHPKDDPIHFRIGPLSFFQTNTTQADSLYRITAGFADLTGSEHVYDLYTGTGSIACYISRYTGHVTGIESVTMAVEDARMNAMLNNLHNITFFTGEAEKWMTPDFVRSEGLPDIIITDPPRNGMHEKVIRSIMECAPSKIVYVSCNPATQARDIQLLSGLYSLEKCQPVDMFPHTQHVENVALLKKRS